MREGPRRDALMVGVPACAAAAVVLWLGMHWPLSADQLVYAQQAAGLDLSTRTVHLGWVLLLALGGGKLALGVQALSAAVVVLLAARLHRDGRDPVSAWVVLAAVLPLAGVLEVDLLCTALVALTAWDRHPLRRTLWLALALLVSPMALLALPWLWLHQDPDEPRTSLYSGLGLWLGVVTLAGGGDWLVGERGLLAVPSWRLRPVLAAWADRLPWLVLLAVVVSLRGRAPRAWLGVLPLLLAPSDVPVQLLATMILVSERPRGLRFERAVWVLAALQLVVSLVNTHEHRHRAQERHLVLQQTAQSWQPGDAAIATWSVGVQLSTMVTGAAYGLPWRSERAVLARQEALWCGADVQRVHWWQHDRFELRTPTDPDVVDLLGCSAPLPR